MSSQTRAVHQALRVATSLSSPSPSTSRCLSTSSVRMAAPVKKAGKANYWARKKGAAADEEASGSGASVGNVLDQVTTPAPDLSSLKTFQPETTTKAAIGQPRAFSNEALALFKTTGMPPLVAEEFKFSKRPATVVRKATLNTLAAVDAARKGSSADHRLFLSGPAGCGKSVTLLQTVAYAHASGWIVLYIPSATPLVNSSTPHSYNANSAIFEQPVLASQLISKFLASNKAAFKKIKSRKAYTFGELKVADGTTLDVLCSKVSEKTPTAVLTALLEELAAQDSAPVLLAVDDAQGLFTTSKYVDPTYRSLESFQLAVPRLLLDFAAANQSFKKGAVVLSHSTLSPTKSAAVKRFLGDKTPQASSAYSDVGTSFEIYSGALGGFKQLQIPTRLERQEAIGLVDLIQGWRGSRTPMSDETFLERFMASDGNPRQLRRGIMQSVQL